MGHYQQEDMCIPCATGTYKSQFGQLECTQCPTGQTTLDTGANDCGKFSNYFKFKFTLNTTNNFCVMVLLTGSQAIYFYALGDRK